MRELDEMLTVFAIKVIAYLLVGCLLMLGFNEVRSLTRAELVKGMLIWPILVGVFIVGVFLAYAKRFRRTA